jgi:Protein of unknown function (DUF2281)
MTHKEVVVELLDQMPDDLIREVRHYAEFLYAHSQHAEWAEMTLAYLAARYEADEVEYTMDDLKP